MHNYLNKNSPKTYSFLKKINNMLVFFWANLDPIVYFVIPTYGEICESPKWLGKNLSLSG